MAEQATRTFELNGATYHLVAEHLNRHRDNQRRVIGVLRAAGIGGTTANEFATLCAYTADVQNGWRPPSPLASESEILFAYEAWLDLPAAITDMWIVQIFSKPVHPATAPVALEDSADPK